MAHIHHRLSTSVRGLCSSSRAVLSSNPFTNPSSSSPSNHNASANPHVFRRAAELRQRAAVDPAPQQQWQSTKVSKGQYVFYSVVALASLLAGASVVHNIYKPDLTLPDLKNSPASQPKA